MNLLIGVIKHCGFDRISTWAKSAAEHCKDAKKVILCLDEVVPPDFSNLTSLGIEVAHVKTPATADVDKVKYERTYYLWEYLNTTADKTDIVVTTDSLDVVFQADPFLWYKTNKKNELLIGSEGISIRNEHWNMRMLNMAFPEHVAAIAENDVMCSGVLAGEAGAMQELLLKMFEYSKAITADNIEGPDQHALNVLMNVEDVKRRVQVTTSTEAFVVHCAVSGPTDLFESWGFKKNYKYRLPSFNGAEVVNADGVPYCIVHQYNRVREWNDFFAWKYKNGPKPHMGAVLAPVTRKEQDTARTSDTAVVVCSRVGSPYTEDWNNVFRFDNDDYVMCDLSSKNVPKVTDYEKFVSDNVINYNESFLREALNFHENPSDKHWWNIGGDRNIIWFYPHFRMLYFYLIHPEYKYYWFFDDDVTWPNKELYGLVDAHVTLDHDCMVAYIFGETEDESQPDALVMDEKMVSYHAPDCTWLSHYPGPGDKQPEGIKKTYGSYYPMVRFSNRAMAALLELHRNGYYGYSEGYTPTVLAHGGMSLYSIYNKSSKIKANEALVAYHRRYHQMKWENL